MVNVKFSLCLTKHRAVKTQWGTVGTAPHILNLGTRLELSDQLHTTAAIAPGGISPRPDPVDRRPVNRRRGADAAAQRISHYCPC
jgi:hypothetical protein